MEVTGLSADTFWKGETEIRGEVTDGTERYRVRILRKGSQIFDYSCSRVDKNGKRTGYCSLGCHGERRKHSPLPPWRGCIWSVYKKGRDGGPETGIHVPEGPLHGTGVYQPGGGPDHGRRRRGADEADPPGLFFQGPDPGPLPDLPGKVLPVKDLVTFSQAVEFERFLEYGKGRSFHHSLTAFEEECRPLVLLVLELVGAYRSPMPSLSGSSGDRAGP